MRAHSFGALIAVATSLSFAVAQPAAAACIKIRNAAGLEQIRDNLAGSFCLVKDISLRSIANFVPIGVRADAPFTGTFDGKGHALAYLKISSGDVYVGLFGYANGTIKNVSITSARVSGSHLGANVGVLAGHNGPGGLVMNVRVDGVATGTATGAEIGGAVGENEGKLIAVQSSVVARGSDSSFVGGVAGVSKGSIQTSGATGAVSGGPNGTLGGLLGWISTSGSSMQQSYAAGSVSAIGDNGVMGGLVGSNKGAIKLSSASGTVTGHKYATVGGLVGDNSGTIAQSQASGVAITGDYGSAGGLAGSTAGVIGAAEAFGGVSAGDFGSAGGLIGSAKANSTTTQGLSAGQVTAGPDSASPGGLVGSVFQSTVTKSYWDTQTSGIATSAAGVGATTIRLRHALPNGFAARTWTITPGASYPYFVTGVSFNAALATIVFGSQVFTLPPIGQLDPAQYGKPVTHPDAASQAATFTSIARSLGATRGIPALVRAAIDDYWDDETQEAVWQPPLSRAARLGKLVVVAARRPLPDQVRSALVAGSPVILRGSYDDNDVSKPHWLLATGFIVDSNQTVTGIVADDPWTNAQVTVDPTSKTVISPPGFPLGGFTVDGYQVVTFKPAS